MFGTIAKLRIKPGKEAELDRISRRHAGEIDGLLFEHVLRAGTDPHDLTLVVGFRDEASYRANAASPEQHQRYLELRELLQADPEWHDGEIVTSTIVSSSIAAA